MTEKTPKSCNKFKLKEDWIKMYIFPLFCKRKKETLLECLPACLSLSYIYVNEKPQDANLQTSDSINTLKVITLQENMNN